MTMLLLLIGLLIPQPSHSLFEFGGCAYSKESMYPCDALVVVGCFWNEALSGHYGYLLHKSAMTNNGVTLVNGVCTLP